MTAHEAMSTAAHHFHHGQLAPAEALCRQVLTREPQNVDALHLLGLIAHQAGYREPAVDLLRRAAGFRRDSYEIQRNLGLALMSVGRHGEAIDAFRHAIALHPMAASYVNLGAALTATGKVDEAIAALRQALRLEPDHAEGRYHLGSALLAKGDVDQAIAMLRRAVEHNPRAPEAYGNLANALRLKGDLEEAIRLYRQALALQPNSAESHYNLGIALYESGRVEDSMAEYRQAIATDPRFSQAHCNLGNLLKEKGQLDEAIAAYRQAIAAKQDYAEAYSSLGTALQDKGALDESIAAHRQAVALRPNLAEAHNNLGNALKATGQLDEAIAEYRQAIELKPEYPEAHYNLGNALRDKGQLDLAVDSYGRGLASRPDYVEAHSNLGNALRDKGELDLAIAAYERAIAVKPDFAEAHSNLGTVLQAFGRYDEAIAAFHRSIALQPEFARAHLNLAIALLLKGELPGAWPEYEWRWKCVKGATFAQPQWAGEDLAGRTILLHPEQGFGDTIHMARYAPMIAARGGRVILECQGELHRLLQNLPGVGQVIRKGDARPEFDLHCPLLSLPRAFGTTLDAIPAQPSFLSADPELVQSWSQRLGVATELKVGLVWAGSSGHLNDKNRSLPLSRFAALKDIPGVRFYSLQKGPAAAQASADPPPLPLTDFTNDLTDFADTAALIENLDLVISVDTAVAHLAAAIGKPVWLLLPFVPDWRWLLDRDDTPWYPTMRLFRQPAIAQWDPVLSQIAERLARREIHP